LQVASLECLGKGDPLFFTFTVYLLVDVLQLPANLICDHDHFAGFQVEVIAHFP